MTEYSCSTRMILLAYVAVLLSELKPEKYPEQSKSMV